MDKTAQNLYSFLHQNSDEDGLWEGSMGTVAAEWHAPVRTVQGALHRLRKNGKVEVIGKNQIVVVSKASVDDIEV